MIPVAPWHYTTWLDLFDHWQTGLAGAGAVIAAFVTIVVTRHLTNRQITTSREETDRVIAATRDQTRAIFKQTETTFDLEQLRNASEALAFHVMLEAAMTRVLAEAAWARKTYPGTLAPNEGSSVDTLAVRQCITKGAFAELRAACVRRGGPLTGDFLDLERDIDSFAMQWVDIIVNAGVPIRMGKFAGLDEQLALIETKADVLRKKAFEAFERPI